MRRATKISALGVALLALGLPPNVYGQTDEERADARAAAIEGAKAFNEGRFADAIDYFQRAESLVHAPPHLLYMARAQAKLGRIVKAREIYRRVANEQLPDSAPPAFQRARTDAAAELPLVEERMPTVKVTLEGADAKSVVVTMDGVTINGALIGLPRPVDPGDHRFQATGNGLQSDVATVTVAERAHETVNLVVKSAPGVTLPAPAGAAAAAPLEAKPEAAPKDKALPPPAADTGASTAPSGSSLRPISYAALGVGVVGLGLGTVFALKSHSTKGDVEKLCPNQTCQTKDQSEVNRLLDSANGQGRVAYIGFVVGGVGVAAGVTLFVLGGSSQKASGDHASVETWVGPSSLGMRGKF